MALREERSRFKADSKARNEPWRKNFITDFGKFEDTSEVTKQLSNKIEMGKDFDSPGENPPAEKSRGGGATAETQPHSEPSPALPKHMSFPGRAVWSVVNEVSSPGRAAIENIT